MGGWKNTWNQGYSLPSRDYIQKNLDDTSQYVFTTPLAYHFEGVHADDFEIRIVLPEGATDIRVNVPIEMEHSTEKGYHFLDMRGGRTEVILTKQNLHPNIHTQDVTVTYRLSETDLLVKPLILVAYALVFYLLVGIYFSFQSK